MRFIAIMVILLLFYQNICLAKAYITYEISSRLGDQLIGYCVARKIAFDHDVPFLFQPFDYSNQLVLSVTDQMLSKQNLRNCKRITIGYSLDRSNEDQEKDYLYIVGFDHWKISSNDRAFYGISNKREFRTLLKKLIAPRCELQTFNPSKDHINIAMHVRTGEGYDPPELVDRHEEKFPKEPFYIASMRKIQKLYPDESLYVHIFTDALYPERVKNRFQQLFIENPKITFYARSGKHKWNQNVLEDLFSMAKFDCLIRPRSGLSAVAQAIGAYKVVIYPGGEIVERNVHNKAL